MISMKSQNGSTPAGGVFQFADIFVMGRIFLLSAMYLKKRGHNLNTPMVQHDDHHRILCDHNVCGDCPEIDGVQEALNILMVLYRFPTLCQMDDKHKQKAERLATMLKEQDKLSYVQNVITF